MFGKYEGLDYEACQVEAAFNSFENNTWWLHDHLALNNEELADTCLGNSSIHTFKMQMTDTKITYFFFSSGMQQAEFYHQ